MLLLVLVSVLLSPCLISPCPFPLIDPTHLDKYGEIDRFAAMGRASLWKPRHQTARFPAHDCAGKRALSSKIRGAKAP